MKKLIILALVAVLMSSCTMHKSTVRNTTVKHPTIESTTMATLNISKKRINYTYVPERTDSRRLPEARLIQNAIFKALAANGNADVLVQVNTYTTVHKGLCGRRIKSISVSGYPAYYTNFREPSKSDLENVYIFNQSGHATDCCEGDGSVINRIFKR
ncbi:MAG: hypothetical protein IIW52_06435 [Alistipes sp.]|nr:hypothetical protein [Alistipes sp.]